MVASIAPEAVFDGESFINEYYAAWSAMDEDRILSYYANNVVLQIPGTLMEGKEALRNQFIRPFITAFPGNRHLVKNMIFVPGVAIVEFDFQARHQGLFAGHEATGVRVNVPGCGVYEFDSAKRQITAARIYFDVGTLLQTITDFPANDRKKAAAALHLNERNLSLIINTIPTAAWTTRADGYCDFLNQRWLDYAGMTAEQAAGCGRRRFIRTTATDLSSIGNRLWLLACRLKLKRVFVVSTVHIAGSSFVRTQCATNRGKQSNGTEPT
jgi:PAS domain-containing protein